MNQEQYFSLIVKDKIDKLFGLLDEAGMLYKDADLFMCKSRWSGLQKEIRLGTISYEAKTIEKNKIVKILIEKGDEIFKTNKTKDMLDMNYNAVSKATDNVEYYVKLQKKVRFRNYSGDLKKGLANLISELKAYQLNAYDSEIFDADGKDWEKVENAIAAFSSQHSTELRNKEKAEAAFLKKLVGNCEETPTFENGKALAEALWVYDASKDYRQRFKDVSAIGGNAMAKVMGEMADEVEAIWDRVK